MSRFCVFLQVDRVVPFLGKTQFAKAHMLKCVSPLGERTNAQTVLTPSPRLGHAKLTVLIHFRPPPPLFECTFPYILAPQTPSS